MHGDNASASTDLYLMGVGASLWALVQRFNQACGACCMRDAYCFVYMLRGEFRTRHPELPSQRPCRMLLFFFASRTAWCEAAVLEGEHGSLQN
jgi:hypothetical protein